MWRIKTTKDAVWLGGWIGGRGHSVALPYVTKGGVWLGKTTKGGVCIEKLQKLLASVIGYD